MRSEKGGSFAGRFASAGWESGRLACPCGSEGAALRVLATCAGLRIALVLVLPRLLFHLGHLSFLAYLRTLANSLAWSIPVLISVPAMRDRPPPVFLLAPGSTSFHHPLNTLTRVISSVPRAGLRRRPAPDWRCLFLKRGQAIERTEAGTGQTLVRRAAPAFLLIGYPGRHLSMRADRPGPAALPSGGTRLALLSPAPMPASPSFFLFLFFL